MARHTPYYDFDGQNNLQTVNTYVMGIPAPIVADRIWDTRANALSYIADANGSAFPGMRLTVIKDSTDDNNGLYYVKPTLNGSGNPVRPYSLVKLTNDINALSLITANSASSVTEITTNQADPYVNLTKKATYDASTYTLVDSIHFSGQKDGSNNDVIKVVGNAGSVAINFPTVSPHYVLAGPSTGSSSAVPSFRQLKIEEIDELDSLGSTTGYLKRIATGTAPNITYSWELGTPSGGGDGTVTEISHGDGIKFRTALDDADLTTITSTGKIKLEFANSSAIGGIKLGFTNDNTNRKYAVQLGANSGESASERAYVQVPTFSASGTNHKAGLVVDPGSTAGSKKFLREDASWNQVSMENISEVTTNSTSTGFLKRTSSGTAPNITYGWSFVSESNIDTKVTQTGTNTNAGYPILLKYTNDTGNETNTVWFANATNNGATINANSGKITCPGFILRESGSGITTKKILVGDGTSITAPASGDDGKFLKANVASGGTVSFSWDSTGGGTDTKTDQTIIANPSRDASKRPLLIAKGTTASTSINDETLFTKSLYYTPKADTLYVGNVETTGNVTASGNISGVNISASGKFSGKLEAPQNQYYTNSSYGVDMKNSDIINANSIYFGDVCSEGEGIHFRRTDAGTTYDSLFVDTNGKVKFYKGWTLGQAGSTGTTEEVLHTGNTLWNTTNTNLEIGPNVRITNGTNVTFTPSTTSGVTTVTISATGGGGGGSDKALLVYEQSRVINDPNYPNQFTIVFNKEKPTLGDMICVIVKSNTNEGSSSQNRLVFLFSNATGGRCSAFTSYTSSSSYQWYYLRNNNLHTETLYFFEVISDGTVSGNNVGLLYKFEISQASSGTINITRGDGILFRNTADTADLSQITSTGKIKLKQASTGEIGGIKVAATNASSAGTVTTDGTYYPVVTTSSGQACVNISGAAGSAQSMAAYSLKTKISYTPLEFISNILSLPLSDGVSNDVSCVTDALIREVNQTHDQKDGHVPVGPIILIYAAYLHELNLTSGRLIIEMNGLGDYSGYIICRNDGNSYATSQNPHPSTSSPVVLDINYVDLFTFNWTTYGSGLPLGINDYVSQTAALVGNYNDFIGGKPDNLQGDPWMFYHKYIFTFSDIKINSTMYTTFKSSIYDKVVQGKHSEAAEALSLMGNDAKSSYFDNITVTLEHRSCAFDGAGQRARGFDRFIGNGA